MAPSAAAAGTAPYQPALIQSLGSAAQGGGGVPQKAAVITAEFGPLTICASQDNTCKPDVSTLSLLQLPAEGASNEEDREIPLFGENPGEDDQLAPSVAAAALLGLLPSLLGIEERLADAASARGGSAAAAAAAGKDGVGGQLEEFLSRSEAVVAELLAAIDQHRQRLARAASASASAGGRNNHKRKRSAATATVAAGGAVASGEDTCTIGVSVSYYVALFQQLYLLELQEDIDTIDLADDLSRVTISCLDAAKRSHELTVDLPKTFPTCGAGGGGRSSASNASRGPILYCDLPLEFDPKWKSGPVMPKGEIWKALSEDAVSSSSSSSSSFGLVHLYQQYRQVLSSYQVLWADLDEIDCSAWVLEPSLPANRSIAERRIALKPGLSLALTVDPERSRGPPLGARLVGSSADAAGLRERVASIVDETHLATTGIEGEASWDKSRSIKANLEAFLGFDLPSPETTEKADYVSECGICYAHRLPPAGDAASGGDGSEDQDGAIPDAMCCNPSCARSYHETCLFEWLHSLPDARVSFDRVFGTCPYCSESLSVRVLTNTS